MPRILSVDPLHPDHHLISQAAGVIKKGGLIAFPTDTFYGIGADPFDPAAVSRLFSVKGRAASKPILLLIDDLSRLRALVREVSPLAEGLMKAFWPGPLTLIFPAAASLSTLLTANRGTIGIRMPDAAIPMRLIQEAGFPLTATSANRSGEAASTTAADVDQSMGPDLDLIMDGGRCESRPSTLLDLSVARPRLLREGRVSTLKLLKYFKARGVSLLSLPTAEA